MGNACECISRQTDDAQDALLSPEFDGDQPRGPPPPYQPRAPLYAYAQMTEEQRIQLVQRLTLIQCLPCGRYADSGKEEKKSLEVDLEESTTVGSGDHGEKKGDKGDKGDKDRECPICMLDFVVGQPIRLLPCMHYYHMRCIDDWLMRSLTCPTCMERVDVGVRNTVISSSQSSLRRRRVGSSSSTTSTISTASTSSSVDQLLTSGSSGSGGGSRGGFGHRQGPQLQLRTTTTPSGSGGHRTHRQQNCNEIQQQGVPQSPPTVLAYRVNPATMNLEPITTNTNVEVRNSSSSSSRGGALRYGGGVSPPGSPLARGRGESPSSPPLIEYHYEYLTMPTTPSNSAH